MQHAGHAGAASQDDANFGFDAYAGEYKDMIEAGIIDPRKVTRTALQDAAGVASLMCTSVRFRHGWRTCLRRHASSSMLSRSVTLQEAMITDLPADPADAAAGGAMGGMGGGMGGMGGMM